MGPYKLTKMLEMLKMLKNARIARKMLDLAPFQSKTGGKVRKC